MKTKKDYKLIAKVVSKVKKFGCYHTGDIDSSINLDQLVEDFIWELKADNPKFDEQKFKEACYGK
jgi:hypothetical protein